MKERLNNNAINPLQITSLVIASLEHEHCALERSNLKVQIEDEIASPHRAGFPAEVAMTRFFSFLYSFSNQATEESNNLTIKQSNHQTI